MADSPDEAEKSAEKAYATASAEVKAAEVAKAETAPKAKPAPVPAETAPAPVEVKKTAAPKKPAAPAPVKRVATKRLSEEAKAKAAKRAMRVARAAAAPPAPAMELEPKPTVTELKEKIMAAGKPTDFAKPIADAFGEIQTRSKAAYEKGTEAVSEMTEFTKGNVEALVESGKIFASGAQALGKTYVDEAKTAYETATADVKEIAAVKSPTELFQLQGKIMRRNFDAFVAAGSKNTEAFFKLANDSFAPLSGRMTLAAEKISKVA